MEKKTSSISSWLKRIFSLQTITVVATVLGTYYAWVEYIRDKDPEISLQIYDHQHKDLIDLTDYPLVLTFFTLDPDDSEIYFNTSNHVNNFILPNIKNNSKKSLKNFKCKVSVRLFFDDLGLDEGDDEIGEEFEVLRTDSHSLQMTYKENVLHAQSSLPVPLRSYWFDEEHFQFLIIEYSISYDGLEKPLYFIDVIAVNSQLSDAKDIKKSLLCAMYEVYYPSEYKTENDKCLVIKADDNNFEYSIEEPLIGYSENADTE